MHLLTERRNEKNIQLFQHRNANNIIQEEANVREQTRWKRLNAECRTDKMSQHSNGCSTTARQYNFYTITRAGVTGRDNDSILGAINTTAMCFSFVCGSVRVEARVEKKAAQCIHFCAPLFSSLQQPLYAYVMEQRRVKFSYFKQTWFSPSNLHYSKKWCIKRIN